MIVAGLVLGFFLVSSLFASIGYAEAKTGAEHKTQSATKKDIREIKKPSEDKTVKIVKITKSRTLSILYIVGLETCAGRERLYSPEIDLKSDRDSITVKVSGLIMPNACKFSEFFIRADDPNSITVGFSKRVYYDQR